MRLQVISYPHFRHLEQLNRRERVFTHLAAQQSGRTMFAVATVAAYLPARRAARIDPVHARRCE